MKRVVLIAIALFVLASVSVRASENWVRVLCLNGQHDPWLGYYVLDVDYDDWIDLRLEAQQPRPFDSLILRIVNVETGAVWLEEDLLGMLGDPSQRFLQFVDRFDVEPGLYEVRLTGYIGLRRWTDVKYICP